MNILGVARTLPFHSVGGMQVIAWDLFVQFSRMGHSVTVITTSIPGRVEPFEVDGVTVVPLQRTLSERTNSFWWKASAQWFLDNSAKSVNCVLSISSAGASIAACRNYAPQARFIFQAHGTSWGEVISKWRTRNPIQIIKSVRNLFWFFKDAFIYKKFDSVVLVGDVLQHQFDSAPVSWISKGVKTTVIRNGVDQNIFKPNFARKIENLKNFGWGRGDRVVVFAARFHPQKGGELALRAFSTLLAANSNFKLLMIGGGEDTERLKRLSVELNCESSVCFTGSVSRESMASLLTLGDAFIFPTLRQEGLPMNVLEALAVGLRTICSESLKGVFSSDLPIVYVNPKDLPTLSSALLNALGEGSSVSTLLSSSYYLDFCARRYIEIFENGVKDK